MPTLLLIYFVFTRKMAATFLNVADRRMATLAMSGHYQGMYAQIKKICPSAELVSCAANSWNLVGQFAVDCCVKAVLFFETVQEVFNFFQRHVYVGAVSKIV